MKIFISYASEDKDFAKKLANDLRKEGLDIWIYEWEIKVGDSITEKINTGLRRSDTFIIVFSKSSVDKPWVKRELNSTLYRKVEGEDITILPIKLNDCVIPPLFSDIYYADFSLGYGQGYQELLGPIKDKLPLEEVDERFLDDARIIDQILAESRPTKRQCQLIFTLIQDESYENYFFKKVESPVWFRILLRKGLFHSYPGLIQGKDKEYYRISFWAPLKYLERMAKYAEFSDDLTNIMQKITESGVDNYYTYYVFTKMSINFEPEKSAKVIPLVRRWLISRFDNRLVSAELGKLLKHLLEGNQIDPTLELVKIVTEAKEEKEKVFGLKEAKAIMDVHWLEKLIKENISLIVEKCPERTINVVSANLTKAIDIEYENTDGKTYRDGSYGWRPAIEEHTQNSRLPGIKEILVIFIRDILVSILKRGDKAEDIVKDFMSHKIPIFRRLAIFVFTEFIKEFRDTIEDELLKDEKIFSDTSVYHELYRFINLRFGDLSESSQKFILNGIKKGPQNIPSVVKGERKERSTNIWMQKWLAALEGQGVREVEDLLANLRKKTGAPPPHPAFLVYSETYWGEESPISGKEILGKNNKEIAKYLKDFKETRNFREPTVEGLGRTLGLAVKENPSKFENDLTPFLTVAFYYLYEIISAFERLWSDNKEINWQEILRFCQQLVKDESFWKEERDGKRFWLTGAISTLIESGTQEDKHAFNEKLLPIAREILIEMVKNETHSSDDLSDPVTAALNSAKGKVLSSLLTYALRYVRIKYKNKNKGNIPLKKWEKEVEEVFTERLNKKIDKSLEVHTILGQYLPQFNYLDKSWVNEHLKEIFPEGKDNEKYWEVAFDGYLFNNKVYGDIYKPLRNEYKRAIKTNFRYSNAQERLAQHLCVVYLRGLEDLESENSLTKFYLDKAESIQIQKSIGFLWGLYKNKVPTSQEKQKVLSFWKYRYGKVVKKTNIDDYRKEISDYIKFGIFVDEIDDKIYEMLKLSIKYVEVAYNTAEAIEFLKKNSSKYPKEVAELFNIMIDNCQIIPTYEKQDIREIFENLYETKNREVKELTDRIINNYGERGIEDFRDLYEKYKK